MTLRVRARANPFAGRDIEVSDSAPDSEGRLAKDALRHGWSVAGVYDIWFRTGAVGGCFVCGEGGGAGRRWRRGGGASESR